MGNDVIMTPSDPLYLNRVQEDPEKEPHGPSFSINTLERVYEYHPFPKQLSQEERKHIKGVQIAVWTEFISSVDHLEYILLPRMPAFAELSWTGKEDKNFDDFVRRLNAWHYQAWKQKGKRFHPAYYSGSQY
ncbi:family 20 glycosylhydrolase [Echinicola marina]|uniref:family 20 glycosylhydrolase n=1 Tax=Echinicola marina TaxID=2859768 RepID=UPI001CF6D665|nr:family 20 glycosylhydrolase [Echinicola marina]UCS93374.1 family 20 glycosylhydrolase [Echinicola marina]